MVPELFRDPSYNSYKLYKVLQKNKEVDHKSPDDYWQFVLDGGTVYQNENRSHRFSGT